MRTRHCTLAACAAIMAIVNPQSSICDPSDTVYLHVGDWFQDSINHYNSYYQTPRVYVVDSGIHRLQDVVPGSGETFVGREGAVMNGARLLSDWQQRGNLWSHGGQIQQGRVYGLCEDGYPACAYPEDLFFNDSLYKHVRSLAEVGPGTWYFDYATDSVYIGEDPAGHIVEVSAAERAFGGLASGVTIKNLVIEKYATPAQEGAITNQWPGDDWAVIDCELRFNHSTGVQFRGRNCTIRGNYVHHNGQKGIGVVEGGDSSTIEDNEIAWNNWIPIYSFGWEGGGTKFAYAKNLVVRNNYVHHNYGPGLWCDISCDSILFEGNRCEYNMAEGLFYETSYNGVIRCNEFRNNAVLMGANLQLGNSSGTQVYNNVVEVHPDYGNAITIVNIDRYYAPLNERWYSYNNTVHHNEIIFKAGRGRVGYYCEYECDSFYTQGGNTFDFNTYHVPDTSYAHWIDRAGIIGWDAFREAGNEGSGTVDTDTSALVLDPDCANSIAIRKNHGPYLENSPMAGGVRVRFEHASRSLSVRFAKPSRSREGITLYDSFGRRVLVVPIRAGAKTATVSVANLSAGNFYIVVGESMHVSNSVLVY